MKMDFHHHPGIRITLLLFAVAAGVARPVHAQQTQPSTQPTTRPASRTEMILSLVNERLASVRADLAAIPADVAKDGPEGLRRAALARRVSLLEEYLSLSASVEQWAARRTRAEERIKIARQELAALAETASPTTAPATAPALSKEGFEALRTTVAQQRDRVIGLRATIADRRVRQADIPRLIAEARQRAADADKRSERVVEESGTDAAGRKLGELRLENLRTERYVANKQVELLQAEADVEPVSAAMRALELEVAEKQLERSEQAFAAYGEALKQALSLAQQGRENEVSRWQEQVKTAASPAERFVAEHEAAIAMSMRNRAEAGPRLVTLETAVADQEKRLAAEKEELAGLREFLKTAGSSRYATERIKLALEQVRQRRAELKLDQRGDMPDRIDEYRSRRFELEQILVVAGEQWKSQYEKATAGTGEGGRQAFAARTAGLLDRYRSTLREERDLLADVLARWQQLQLLRLQRTDTQDDLERFIRATAFWLRDGKPLSPGLLPELWRETAELAAWSADVVSETMVDRTLRAARTPLAALYAALLFPVLPIALFVLRQRLRRVVKARNQATLDSGGSIKHRVTAIIAGVLGAAVLPAYFYAASKFIATAGLPAAVWPVAAALLAHVSYFLLLWFLSRGFFAGRSIAQVQLGMPAEASNAVWRSLRMSLLGYLVLLLPWILFRQPPFDFETIPRLGYTGFEIVAALAVARLIRTRSPFMRYAFAETDNHLAKRHWGLINGGISLLMLAIIALDILGYRYGAASLAVSFVKSLATMIFVIPLYAGAKAMLATIAAQQRWTEPPTEEAAQRRLQIERRVGQAIRIAFVLVSIVLLAMYWGIDLNALKTLDNLHLYTVRGGEVEEHLTAADVVRCAMVVGATLWVLWALPGIYEFAIFPRLKLDEGLKYAILTISRYAVFGVGLVMSMSATHLDFGRLGWLVAAMGVGLGFGLQEIVSNFVSGIILLVERPIQVGDVVTVGSMSGTVKRINIRATTIVNFDRQEVIVPNRSLITTDVTNWTRGDTINRLVIRIGVAYGSDVDHVSHLLRQIAESQPAVLKDPPPQVIFMAHGESSLDFELRVFAPSPAVLADLRDRLNKAINREFAKNHIEIPFPQRDLHIRSDDTKAAALVSSTLGKTDIPVDTAPPRK